MKGIASIALICLLSPAFASGPGQAAVDFLQKIREGEVNLAPDADTALHPRTSADKIELIRKGLEKVERQLGETPGFEVGGIREEGGFAAVIVRQAGGFDETKLQVFPVALVKRGDDWLPAPVLASFENAVAGYTVPLRERLSGLEEWMMRERVLELSDLVSKSTERMRERIRASLVGEDLEGDDLARIVEGFLKACGDRNQAAVLGYLGGAGAPWPDDWETRKSASRIAVSEEARSEYPWRLLTAPEVIRIPVHEEKTADSGLVSLACLDPARASGGAPAIVVLHFEFEKDTQRQWRIGLPGVLLRYDAEEMALDADLDSDLADRFPGRLREQNPPESAASPEEAAEKVIQALKSGTLRELLKWVDATGGKRAGRDALAAGAADWWSLNEPGVFRTPLRLGARTEGTLSVVACQWFSAARSDRFKLKPLYFRKSRDGWVWMPGPAPDGKERETLSGWLAEGEAEWRRTWKEKLLGPSIELEGLELAGATKDEKVGRLAGTWLETMRKRDISGVLELSAWLETKDGFPSKGMRNLAYEMQDVRQGGSRIGKIYRADGWVVATFVHGTGKSAKHKFMPVVRTEGGLRFIPEIDLVAGSDRTRDFLNRASFDRLEPFVEGDELSSLKTIFKKFAKDVDAE